MARQVTGSERAHSIDIWSKPLCEIRHADHLPVEITHPSLPRVNDLPVSRKHDILRTSASATSTITRDSATQNFSIALSELIGKKSDNSFLGRTAFIAFNCLSCASMEPDLTEVLSAFRSCYDRVIGHIHIEQRGFVHWQKSVNSFSDIYFSRIANQCDAVIMTSSSLIEHDSYLSSRLPTERLVGQLIERLVCALLDKDVVDQIAPVKPATGDGEVGKPRVFAMGSAGSHKFCPGICEPDLARQRELVFSSFGKPLAHPLLIATLIDDNSIQAIRGQLVGTNIEFLSLASSTRSPSANNELGGPHDEWSEFITLWPFDPKFGPWP